MENVMTLKAESRSEVGKQFARKLRNSGRIPAIIYGESKDAIPISIALEDVKEVLKSESGENTVLRIQRDDIQVDAMLKEIQWDYLSNNIIHLDLIRIDLSKPVHITVPIRVVGVPLGVKVDGGFFDFMTREVRVKCLPTRIPREFVINVTELRAGDTFKVKNLEVGEGITIQSSPNTVICYVTARGADEEGGQGDEENA